MNLKKDTALIIAVIRNLPYKKAAYQIIKQAEKILLYQGAVNEARGIRKFNSWR